MPDDKQNKEEESEKGGAADDDEDGYFPPGMYVLYAHLWRQAIYHRTVYKGIELSMVGLPEQRLHNHVF